MEEKECNVVTLEDNIEYTELGQIKYNSNTYVVLADLENPKNYCVRKLEEENGNQFIIGIDTEEEFNNVMTLFAQKYTN